MNKNNKNKRESVQRHFLRGKKNSGFIQHHFSFLKSGAGFTLIEAIIYIFGFGLIAYGLIALVSQIFLSTTSQTNLLSDIDQARKVSFQIVSEFRNAGTGSNGAYALDTAGDQQLVFYANIDSDPSVEKIRYFLQSGSLKKGVTKYSGGTYNPAAEKVSNVQRNVANGPTNPLFYYYDGSYVGSSTQSSLSQPVSVTQVKMVKIELNIFNVAGVKNTNTYRINTSSAIRNLKTNLGD